MMTISRSARIASALRGSKSGKPSLNKTNAVGGAAPQPYRQRQPLVRGKV